MTNDVANVAAVLIERHERHAARQRLITLHGQNYGGIIRSNTNFGTFAHSESLRITRVQV